jgi:hypothetical protein
MEKSVRSERNGRESAGLGTAKGVNPERIGVVAPKVDRFMQLGFVSVLYEGYSDHP